jgi:branched-chain amino acid transport system ATP-binding protein
MTRPRTILVDEPALGLAPMIVARVYEILRVLREEGNTLVMVEPNTHRALENADRIYVMRSAQIVLHGLKVSLTEQELERAYFGFDGKAHSEQAYS